MQTFLLSVIVTIVAIFQTCWCVGQSSAYSCGESVSLAQIRITHGWEADSAMWPWHAAIFRRANDTNDHYICGATLVGQNFVVTAAHCVINRATGLKLNRNLLTVHFGRQYLNESDSARVQERSVKDVIIHPQFLHVGLKNDIALLALKAPVEFTDYVLPVCLDKLIQSDLKSDDLVGKDGVIVGWGKTERGQVSNSLQTARMPVIDRIICLNSDPQFFSQLISYGMFCAGYENGTSICNGDSGSGMFFREGEKWMLGGIVSFSGLKADRISCDFHKYAGFTNVRYYVPWLRTIVNDGTSTILDTNEMGISSGTYTCKYASSKSSHCELSNIRLSQGASADFNTNKQSPTRVTLQRSYLQFMPKSLIDAFPEMEYLSLENLRIRNFEPNAFKTAANLLSINLQMNRLEEIPRNAFAGASSVEHLDLSSNRINFIDEFTFESMVYLKNLNVSSNRITNLPSFSRNNDLQTINASYNRLNDVGDDYFVRNNELRTLDIAHNRLTHLDLQQLDASRKLGTIDVSFNRLKRLHIPKHVKHLYAQNNSIEHISSGKCVAETLHLAANKLQTLLGVSNCTLLSFLDLSNNLLQSFDYRFIAQMPKLQSLYLSHNRLLEIDLPQRMSPASSLKVLDLSHNLIIHGPSTNAFGKLETIQLSHNELQQFDFSKMNQLRKVYLSSNQWDCSILRSIRADLRDSDPASCAEGFRKIHDICCKDYMHPYGDMLAAVTRQNIISDLRKLDFLKGSCSVPVTNRTVDQQTKETLDEITEIEKVKKNIQAYLDATLQVKLTVSKEFEAISATLQSMKDKRSAITQVIERQRTIENSTNDHMLIRDGKSDLEVLKEILISKVEAVRSSYNSLAEYKQYIANIPSRKNELNRAIPQLKHLIRSMRHDLIMLENEEKSMIMHYNGLSRTIQNINNAPSRNDDPSASYQQGPRGDFYSHSNVPAQHNYATTSHQQGTQGGFYSEQSYRYEYSSSNFG